MSPLTVLILTLGRSLPCTVTAPETALTLRGQASSLYSTLPLTVLRSRSPARSLSVSVPETVLALTVPRIPETRASALTVATLVRVSTGTEMLSTTRLRLKLWAVRLTMSRKFLSESLPWVTARAPSSHLTSSGRPSMSVTSIRAVGESSWVTTSTRPPTMPTLSCVTRSFSSPMSRTFGASICHSCAMSTPVVGACARASEAAYEIYRVW